MVKIGLKIGCRFREPRTAVTRSHPGGAERLVPLVGCAQGATEVALLRHGCRGFDSDCAIRDLYQLYVPGPPPFPATRGSSAGSPGSCAALVREYKDKDYDFGIDLPTVEALTGLDKALAEGIVSALTRSTTEPRLRVGGVPRTRARARETSPSPLGSTRCRCSPAFVSSARVRASRAPIARLVRPPVVHPFLLLRGGRSRARAPLPATRSHLRHF